MPPTCRICPREDRERIDEALLRGVSTRSIAKQCEAPAPSAAAVLRHKAHVTERIARARDAQEVAGADTLLGKIADLEATARRLLTKSEKRGKLGVSVAALRELRGVVELLARVTGELKGSGGVTVNILGSPEWFSLQRKILEALAPFPEARLSVARALLPAGNGGGPPDA